MSSNLNLRYYIAIIMSENKQKEAQNPKENQGLDDKSQDNIETEKTLEEKEAQNPKENQGLDDKSQDNIETEKTLEEKLSESDDKLVRSLAEV